VFSLDPQIAVSLFGAAIGLVIWTVASQAHEKSVVRDSLRQLDDYEIDNVRDQELLNPLSERALGSCARSPDKCWSTADACRLCRFRQTQVCSVGSIIFG